MDNSQNWSMEGKIYTFDMIYRLVAFTNNIHSDTVLVYIGGLGDTLLSTPYTSQLSLFCTQRKITLIVPQFRSMPNYRIYQISSDVEDLHKIILSHLNKKIILLGHSTGCQISMQYLKTHGSQNIKQVILQAPVSDVEWAQKSIVNLNQELQQARKTQYFVAPSDKKIWLSKRFLSLNQRFNEEDWFSIHLPDEKYTAWKDYNIPISSILSGADKYVVYDNSEKLKLGGKVFKIEGASHSMHQEKSRLQFFKILKELIE